MKDTLTALAADKQTHAATLLTAVFGALSFDHWIALLGLIATVTFSWYSLRNNRREQAERTQILRDLAKSMKTAPDAAEKTRSVMEEIK